MNNPDHISQSLEKLFWVKILNYSPMRIRDEKIRIRNTAAANAFYAVPYLAYFKKLPGTLLMDLDLRHLEDLYPDLVFLSSQS